MFIQIIQAHVADRDAARDTLADAREAEARPAPPEASELLAEEMSLLDDVVYLDLHQPWIASHR